MRYVKYPLGRFVFSSVELFDLALGWGAVSLAFAIVLSGRSLSRMPGMLLISLVVVGVAFLFHEMGHKFVAQKYGYFAEFRAFKQMLLAALAMSFFGFVFAAPGAVMIMGNVRRDHYGKISAAGPLVNFVFAGLFYLLSFFSSGFLLLLLSYGFIINAWIGLFNLIPFGEFDGRKILSWNRNVYGFFCLLGLVLLVLSFTVMGNLY